ncbi:hypothetical protein LUZ60_003010 [Juncus effusus]|nr:hypothetical protein LUZ60_003010 [Juncus effusus]
MPTKMDENLKQSEVTITKTINVQPRNPNPNSPTLELSNLDRKCRLLMYLVFFYKSNPAPSHHEMSSFFTSLRDGLEETLSDWYTAAGRLCFSAKNDRTLDLSCTYTGTTLVEAETCVEIEQLENLCEYKPFYEKLVYKPPTSLDLSNMPLVVAQVTKFSCGGYALGVGTNHALFDGFANYDFIRTWAHRTIGRKGDEIEFIQPIHERDRLLINPKNSGKGDNNREMYISRVLSLDHLYNLICQAYGNKDEMVIDRGKFVFKTYFVNSEMVGTLKRITNEGLSGVSCSSFEAIAAHLWKARTKALEIPKERTVCLQFAVDTRTRLQNPPLPKQFAGNAYVLSSISSTTGDLQQKTLATIVQEIKMAKQAINDDYVEEYLNALEGNLEVSLPPIPELIIVSDWTRTPYHEIDFGIGKAAYVSPLVPPVQEAVFFMQNPSEKGGVDVRIGLHESYENSFSKYFLESF